jgi:hypothetical protein
MILQLRCRVFMDTTMADQLWFFTAPEEPVLKRRGDPLGFRKATDGYAELLAPGLSSRTVDGRWLTILCWILRNANELRQRFRPGGDNSLPGDSRQAAARNVSIGLRQLRYEISVVR